MKHYLAWRNGGELGGIRVFQDGDAALAAYDELLKLDAVDLDAKLFGAKDLPSLVKTHPEWFGSPHFDPRANL